MTDLTVIYYTANKIDPRFMRNVYQLMLFNTPPDCAHVSVCQKEPEMALMGGFGHARIIVGDIGASIYNVYVQVLFGAKEATTRYVAMAEDDTVYSREHFLYRPADDVFAYDRSRWVITRKLSEDGKRREAFYYWRERHQMAMMICNRELLIETLEEKFAKYPLHLAPASTDVAKKAGWGEPGRYEKNLGLTLRKMEYFDSPSPSVTFNHGGLMGRRRVNPDDRIVGTLEPWGDATELWNRVHG